MDREHLLRCFKYNPVTGLISVRPDAPGECCVSYAGDYVRLFIKGHGGYIYGHRFAYIAMGAQPPEVVDHINRHRQDNRWINLRASDKSKNGVNQGLGKNNKSGVTGVCWAGSKQRWLVSICNKICGRHTDFFEAVCQRKSLENNYL